VAIEVPEKDHTLGCRCPHGRFFWPSSGYHQSGRVGREPLDGARIRFDDHLGVLLVRQPPDVEKREPIPELEAFAQRRAPVFRRVHGDIDAAPPDLDVAHAVLEQVFTRRPGWRVRPHAPAMKARDVTHDRLSEPTNPVFGGVATEVRVIGRHARDAERGANELPHAPDDELGLAVNEMGPKSTGQVEDGEVRGSREANVAIPREGQARN